MVTFYPFVNFNSLLIAINTTRDCIFCIWFFSCLLHFHNHLIIILSSSCITLYTCNVVVNCIIIISMRRLVLPFHYEFLKSSTYIIIAHTFKGNEEILIHDCLSVKMSVHEIWVLFVYFHIFTHLVKLNQALNVCI